jgi:hypothetical protein
MTRLEPAHDPGVEFKDSMGQLRAVLRCATASVQGHLRRENDCLDLPEFLPMLFWNLMTLDVSQIVPRVRQTLI